MARVYETDQERPIAEWLNYSLVWELDREPVGFSTTDHIVFGQHAFMHLHILNAEQRQTGMGAQFVKLSAAMYFARLELRQLYCQPNAFNVAPNRTLRNMRVSATNSHTTPPPARSIFRDRSPAGSSTDTNEDARHWPRAAEDHR